MSSIFTLIMDAKQKAGYYFMKTFYYTYIPIVFYMGNFSINYFNDNSYYIINNYKLNFFDLFPLFIFFF